MAWVHWDNYWEFLEDAQRPPLLSPSQISTATGGDKRTAPSRSGSHDFTGTNSFDEAMDLAKFGWNGSKVITDAKIELPFKEQDPTAFYFDVTGCVPDVDRFLQGDPECMMEFHPKEMTKRVLRVAIHGGFLQDVETRTVRHRGTWIMHMIDALEAAGYQLDVNVYIATMASGGMFRPEPKGVPCKYMYAGIDLKNAGFAVNRDIIAFALCHASFFRRLGFSIKENEPILFEKHLAYTLEGYGRTEGSYIPPECDIHIPEVQGNDFSAIETLVKDTLKKYGIELEEKK